MRHLVSFRQFLATGTLGPLTPGLGLLEVADLLGPPQDWVTEHAERYPLYWMYSDPNGSNAPRLEVQFAEDPPHAMN